MVYYYYADLSKLNCDVNKKYQIITNIPSELCKALLENGSSLECDNK